jgi:hypothetical protein
MNKMRGKLIIVKNETETFTKSTCNCAFCASMHKASEEWDTFVPETNLQKNMMEVVARIEARETRKRRKVALAN